MIAALIVAAGKGTRAQLPDNKLLYREGVRTVLGDTLAVFSTLPCVVVYAEKDLSAVKEIAGDRPNVTLVQGGATRGESVQAGLKVCLDKNYDAVLIHDGARPYLADVDLEQCIADFNLFGSCVMTQRCTDSVLLDGQAVDRDRVTLVSTPQAFDTAKIMDAYLLGGGNYTDDSQVYAARYGAPHYTTLLRANPKITTREDVLNWSRRIARTGAGFDEHRIAEGRPCILCGITLPLPYGPDGHSDADVPVHALMDALLTGVGERDIGNFFPDNSPDYKNADSMQLLAQVLSVVASKGYAPYSASVVLHAQKPKLSDYIPAMTGSLSDALGIPASRIGISATSGEGMGHIGRGEGIAAYAVATLRPL